VYVTDGTAEPYVSDELEAVITRTWDPQIVTAPFT
jgi:hypothetical protein